MRFDRACSGDSATSWVPREESMARTLREIDRLSPGRIDLREYSVQRPRYAGYALVAIAFWLTAALLKLGFGMFRTFP